MMLGPNLFACSSFRPSATNPKARIFHLVEAFQLDIIGVGSAAFTSWFKQQAVKIGTAVTNQNVWIRGAIFNDHQGRFHNSIGPIQVQLGIDLAFPSKDIVG
jgi:hypothetical protein